MDVLTAVKQGARVMVTMPDRADRKEKYSLTDGTEVSHDQFDRLKPFLAAEQSASGKDWAAAVSEIDEALEVLRRARGYAEKHMGQGND
ncbi:hypothetical protein [Phaeobacter sp. S60]|uniref:hypothetical protein n=1 Tax=Phaeobacter sp. S60 TaxID=1569353 RepID=UPI000AB6BC69|nr:hypothetical protein [Phaeobacter sp. S60]